MIYCKEQNPRFGQGLKVRTATVENGKGRKVFFEVENGSNLEEYNIDVEPIEPNPT
jgi:hypothetical protein